MPKQKIMIAGGGVPGLLLAHRLSTLPVEVTLVEPYPPELGTHPLPDGRTVAIMSRHIRTLKSMGLWDDIAPHAAPLETMRVIDCSIEGRRAAKPYDFKAAKIGESAFAYNIPLRILRARLWEKLASTISIVAAKPDTQFDLIVAADGRNSPTREAAGIEIHKHDTGQTALTFLIRREVAHENVSTEWQRPNGPVTFVPTPDPHLCSVVFVDKTAIQKSLQMEGATAIAHALEDTTHEKVNIVSVIEEYPLIFMQAKELYRNNIVITAEAAHVLHPLGAQGMNLSLYDMSTLADLIESALKIGLSVADAHAVMAAYHKARHTDHVLRAGGVRASLEFLRYGQLTGDVRRGFLGFLAKAPALERALMKAGR